MSVKDSQCLMRFYSPHDSQTAIKHFSELFFRGDFYDSDSEVYFKDFLSSDTYINLIPIDKYRKHLLVDILRVRLAFRSEEEISLSVNLMGVDFSGIKFSIITKIIKLKAKEVNIVEIPLDINKLPSHIAYVYWKVRVLNRSNDTEGRFLSFLKDYSCVIVEKNPNNKVKLAIIMPTYKREKYVMENLIKLKISGLLEKLDIVLLIIDNGKTLKDYIPDDLINEKVNIIENINSGGAGGFARGLLEVFERFSDRTHCVFMDDDIDLEPFVLERLYGFLKVLSDSNLGIGGSMISYKFPHIMWESGAFYRISKRFITLFLNKHNINLLEEQNLLKVLANHPWTYWGWWFFCLPTNVYKRCGLPLPIFFRGDDMEYGFRLVKQNIEFTDLPGVFVLHEDFFAKHNAFTDYLITRNELILRALHSDLSPFYEAKFLLKKILRFLFSYRYETAEMTIKGYEDFLKGPDFLVEIDPEQYYGNLNKEVFNEKTKNIDQKYIKDFLKLPQIQSKFKAKIKKWLHFITFGSHIIPPFKGRQQENYDFLKEDYIIEDLHSYRFSNFFAKSKILYYNNLYNVGYFVYKDSFRFFKIFMKGLYVCLKLMVKHGRVKKQYLKAYENLISENTWKIYLKLSKNEKLQS